LGGEGKFPDSLPLTEKLYSVLSLTSSDRKIFPEQQQQQASWQWQHRRKIEDVMVDFRDVIVSELAQKLI